MTRTLRILFLLAGLALVATPAYAQAGYGVRAGVSGDPDQFFFGGHLETRPIVRNLTFRPNVEIGVGDNVTLVALNIEFAYRLPVDSRNWRIYAGGGPAANVYDTDGDSGVEPGFNLMIGGQHSRGLILELKLGLIDSPDVKFMVGWAFR
jgi:hypothetical protein